MQGEPGLVHEGLFGGEGRVRVWDLLQGRAAEPFMAVLACELEAGGRVGAHRQAEWPELVICTHGSGRAQVDGIPHDLRPGAVVWLPVGSALAIENVAKDEPLLYLIVKARG